MYLTDIVTTKIYQEVQDLCLPSLLSFLPAFPPKGHQQQAPNISSEAW